jgi:hypothetical protein
VGELPAVGLAGDLSLAFAGDFAGSTMLGFVSLA